MRLLGLDASTNKTGFSIFDFDLDGKIELLEYGLIDFTGTESLESTLLLKGRVYDLIRDYQIQYIVIEDCYLQTGFGKFSGGNADTFKKLAKNLGVLEVMFVEEEIHFLTVLPSVWRKGFKMPKERREKKKFSVEYVNEKYGIELVWLDQYKSSKFNEDDIAESIMIGEYGCKKLIKQGGTFNEY